MVVLWTLWLFVRGIFINLYLYNIHLYCLLFQESQLGVPESMFTLKVNVQIL